MSSLAAAQADNFYHHPDYDPQKHGSRNKFQGSTGANQWEKFGIIRFELPCKSWCLGCGRLIGQGTRYNAKKEAVGKYFTTTIYEFTFTCATCPQQFVVRTDPKNSDYAFISGIRKFVGDIDKAEVFDSNCTTFLSVRFCFIETNSGMTLSSLDDNAREKLEKDPMFFLENDNYNKNNAKRHFEQIASLQEYNNTVVRNDFEVNKALRKLNRERRKSAQKLEEEGRKAGLGFSLVEEKESDKIIASEVMRSRIVDRQEVTERAKRKTRERSKRILSSVTTDNKLNITRKKKAKVTPKQLSALERINVQYA